MQEILKKWLESSRRDSNVYSQFEVIDEYQRNDLDEDIKLYLVDSLRNMIIDPDFLREMIQILGWKEIDKLIFESEDNFSSNFIKGDFGEMLFTLILQEFHNYKIPVYKLRFKVRVNQIMPGTDILGLKVNQNDDIIEICYCESKLRTKTDNFAAKEAYEQLKDTFESSFPHILKFIAARLMEQKDPLYQNFMDYLSERRDKRNMDTFRIGLCWEDSIWNERVLENLEDNGVDLPNLIIHVIRISNLKNLIYEILNNFNMIEVFVDD